MFAKDSFDDMPEWVRSVQERIARMNWYSPMPEPDEPLPNTTDTQKRCVICGALLLGDEPSDAETCTAHRKFEHLKLLVLTGEISDWPAKYDWCGTLTKRHIAGMYSTCRVHWVASVKAALAFYNGLHDTRFRFL